LLSAGLFVEGIDQIPSLAKVRFALGHHGARFRYRCLGSGFGNFNSKGNALSWATRAKVIRIASDTISPK
jgi:hypothetical protein